MANKEKVRASKSMTKEELAGEIYDINKKNGYKNPFSRKKAINIMVNGLETEKGYSKTELEEIRDSLLGIKPQKQAKAAEAKSTTTLIPKVAKADELRKAAIKAGDRATRIVKKSNEELQKAKTKEEKEAVRKKYKQKREEAKLESGKAYTEYDNYLRSTFGIDNAFLETNEAYTSTDKGFIAWLQAKFSKKKKK